VQSTSTNKDQNFTEGRKKRTKGFCKRFRVGTIQQFTINSSIKNRYVILQWREHSRELKVYLTIRKKDGRKLKVKVLIDFRCINTTIARKTVEEKEISTKSLPKPFDMYNSDGSRNGEKTIKEFVPLEINSNGHIEQIDVMVSEIKKTDLFLKHDWLVEYNPEVN